jgi:hypothetical protein
MPQLRGNEPTLGLNRKLWEDGRVFLKKNMEFQVA